MPRKIEKGACQDSSGAGLFLSAESALHWAYAVSARSIVNISMINRMREEPRPVCANALLVNLTAQDMHGQAALIIGLIDKLNDPAAREYIKARFGRNLNRDDLRVMVYRGCAGLGLGLDKQEGVYQVIRSYFRGEELSLRSIRKLLECRHHHAAMSKQCLFDVLDTISAQTMAEMREIFEERGLVRPTNYQYG